MAGPVLSNRSEGLGLAAGSEGVGLFEKKNQGWPLGVRVKAGQAKAGGARHGQTGPSMARHVRGQPN